MHVCVCVPVCVEEKNSAEAKQKQRVSQGKPLQAFHRAVLIGRCRTSFFQKPGTATLQSSSASLITWQARKFEKRPKTTSENRQQPVLRLRCPIAEEQGRFAAGRRKDSF